MTDWGEKLNIIENLYEFIQTVGWKILLIVLIVIIINHVAGFFIERLIRRVVGRHEGVSIIAEQKREDTLIGVIVTSLRILLWLIGGVMILAELGVEIGPLLAAAGVVGVAVGFGGQYLIRDLITGLFIILENQYRVGDVVCIGDICGAVESINLRLTRLRDLDGTVHYIPNGEVKTASNLTKIYSRVNLNIGVSYSSNLEEVIQVINRVGTDLATDPDWQDKIIEAPKFLRVDEFGDSAVIVKILGDTEPSAQWEVTGELRKRLKIAFDQAGIEIPFPQRVVHMNQIETK